MSRRSRAPPPPRPSPAPAAPGRSRRSRPPPSAAAPAPSGVTRPNGAIYRPRALADMPDVDALRRLREAGIPALLYGPPGTGKTSLVEAAFGGEVITVAGDGDTTVGDLVGDYTQRDDGSYEFVYGPLITAMTEGKVLFIDDTTLISPAVLAVTYPAMDGRGEVTVKAHKGETIKAAEGFYIIGGHNPNVHGAVLTEALASSVHGPGQGRHRLRPRPRPQDRPPRDHRRPGPGRPAGQRRDRLVTPAPRTDRLPAHHGGTRRERRRRQPRRHRPRRRPRRRRRRPAQSLRPPGHPLALGRQI